MTLFDLMSDNIYIYILNTLTNMSREENVKSIKIAGTGGGDMLLIIKKFLFQTTVRSFTI